MLKYLPRLRERSVAALIALACMDAGCRTSHGNPPTEDAAGPPPARVSPPASATHVGTAASDGGPREIADDWPRARELSLQANKLVFVDVWAAWCHTCLSLKTTVLPDPRLDRLRDRFVWLAIDLEHSGNAAFLGKFESRVLPTLWLIDPRTQSAILKWEGSLAAEELAVLLEEAAAEPGSDAGAAGTHSMVGVSLAHGIRAAAAGKRVEAIALFRESLARAPADWVRRDAATEALVSQLEAASLDEACVETATEPRPHTLRGTSHANILIVGAMCAERLPKTSVHRKRLESLVTTLAELTSEDRYTLLPDDRSGVFEQLVSSLKALGRTAEARKAAQRWADFLEREARRASTKEARAVFDWHRTLACIELGEFDRAISLLRAREREDPGDYNLKARLARAFHEKKAYKEALTAIDQAIALCTGPRRLRLYGQRADTLLAMGNRKDAAATLEQALAFAESIPLPAGYPKQKETLTKRLAELTNNRK